MFRHTAIAAIAFVFSAGPAVADGPETARQVMQEVRESAPIPALSAAVVTDSNLVWAEALGEASLELAVPAQPDHRFRLGSVSKVITASLAARMTDAGLVDLDRAIGDYLPDLPEQHRATTLRQLLTHQGGIRHYGRQDFDFAGPGGLIDLRPAYPTTASALALFIEDPLTSAPGREYSYSTFGYTLAAAVLEAAGGAGFGELVETHVAVPLGLTTLALDEPYSLRPNRVEYYDIGEVYTRQMGLRVETDVVNALPNNPSYKWAGGGMIVTASDLARFGAAHARPGFLTAETFADVFTSPAPRTGKRRRAVLPYFPAGEAIAIVGSRGGMPQDPNWVHNLRANPDAAVRVDRKRRMVHARIATGDERASLWPEICAQAPIYRTYQERAKTREIPVVVLDEITDR